MPRSPIVIAHRGASGYLPEHTLAAKALAHGMGADFLEQDVVLSADGVPLVLHDIYLDTTTDVAARFPQRQRDNGRFYAIDFSLEEIRQLTVHERSCKDAQGREKAVYPQRFPLMETTLSVPTLAEEIDFIDGLNRSRQRNCGLYIEFKAPNWHRLEGFDIAATVLEVLAQKQVLDNPQQVYLQCFDDRLLQRLRGEFKVALPLIQLIADDEWGEDSDASYSHLQTAAGLDYVASYARGIGPWLPQLLRAKTAGEAAAFAPLLKLAKERNLLIHPYTLRREELPPGVASFDELLDICYRQAGVDGVFTDFPDLAHQYLERSTW